MPNDDIYVENDRLKEEAERLRGKLEEAKRHLFAIEIFLSKVEQSGTLVTQTGAPTIGLVRRMATDIRTVVLTEIPF